MVKAFCKYLITRQSISTVQNPFVKELNFNIFSKLSKVNDDGIQILLNRLKNDSSLIEVTDFGAGSKTTSSNIRNVKSIAKKASVSPKFGKLLNQLVTYYKCKSILELGTSLGIGTSYLALNNNQAKIYTLEGCPRISAIADSNLKDFDNVMQFTGEFSTKFDEVLALSGKVDFVYIDGNHTKQATLDYFKFLLNNTTEKAILVFDDIHWSTGMEDAWNEIIATSRSRLTLDFFRMGLVFLDPQLEKAHFIIKF